MRWTLILIGFVVAGCGKQLTTAERFSGPWRYPSAEVMQLLAEKRVEGCGEFYMKRAKDTLGVYLIYCTEDGKIWTAWQAFTPVREVVGPSYPDADIPPPDRANNLN